jgi:hypothetical protein
MALFQGCPNPGDFSFSEDNLKFLYQYDYEIVNKMKGKVWDTLKKHFDNKRYSREVFEKIKKNLHYSHTPESLAKSINTLGFIASQGWEDYVFLTIP